MRRPKKRAPNRLRRSTPQSRGKTRPHGGMERKIRTRKLPLARRRFEAQDRRMHPAAFQQMWDQFLGAVGKAVEAGVTNALAARELAATAPAPLLDKRELARALNISTVKVDRLTAKGEIRYLLVGDVRRYDLAEVRASLAAKKPSPPTPSPAPVPASPTTAVRLLSRPRRTG